MKRTDRSGSKPQYTLESACIQIVLMKFVEVGGSNLIIQKDLFSRLVHPDLAGVPQGHSVNLKSVCNQTCKLCANFLAPVQRDDVPTRKVEPLQFSSLTLGLYRLSLDAVGKMASRQGDAYK